MYKLIKRNIEKEELIEPMVESPLTKPCPVTLRCGPVLIWDQSEKKRNIKKCLENNQQEDPEEILRRENIDDLFLVSFVNICKNERNLNLNF